MRMASVLRPQALPWLLADVLLTVTLAVLLWRGTDAEALLATPAKALNLSSPATGNAGASEANLEVLQERALFYSSRQFHVPTPIVAQVPRPDYRLTGTFIVPNRPAVAMLTQSATGAARRIVPGIDLDGWTVASIDASRVLLRLNGEQCELTRATAGQPAHS